LANQALITLLPIAHTWRNNRITRKGGAPNMKEMFDDTIKGDKVRRN